MGGLVADHVITRSVRDSAAALDATSGPDLGDPYCAPPPSRPFLQEVGADPGRLRIAFATEIVPDLAVHADCVRAVEEAAALCADLGHEVIEAAPTVDRDTITHVFLVLSSAGCASTLEAAALLTGTFPEPDQVEPLTWALCEMGRGLTASAYVQAVQQGQRLARDVAGFFSTHDVLLTPTLAEPPVPLGTFDSPAEDPMRGFQRAAEFAPMLSTECPLQGARNLGQSPGTDWRRTPHP